jgi:CheY-like chemotaxis protein
MSRILVIDDLAPIRATWRDMLEEAGHEVLEARNGEEGLASLAREQIDLVLTDIFMPEKDGIETIGEIRRLCPEVKIIAISGYADDSASPYLRIAQHLGADAALCKPVDPEELISAVSQTLEGATGRQGVE